MTKLVPKHGKPKDITPDMRERIVNALKARVSTGDIAKRFEIGEARVRAIRDELGLPKDPRSFK
jgi:hypothetical protein